MVQQNTLERIAPDHMSAHKKAENETLNLHFSRYRFAAKHLKPGRILDIACGVGYGAYELLLERGNDILSVTAVDISASALSYAKERYYHKKISLIQDDADRYYDHQKFDTIVSLETIEHLNDPEKFIQRLGHMVKENGIVVASVPVTPSVDVNPYHLNDFTTGSFRSLFKKNGMVEIDALLQKQPYHLLNVMMAKGNRYAEIRKNLVAYYLKHPASLIDRIRSIVVDGFCNKYLTLALRKEPIR